MSAAVFRLNPRKDVISNTLFIKNLTEYDIIKGRTSQMITQKKVDVLKDPLLCTPLQSEGKPYPHT